MRRLGGEDGVPAPGTDAGERRLVYLLLCGACASISFNVTAISAAIPAISRGLGYPDFTIARIIPFYLIPYGLGALAYAPMTQWWSFRRILAGALALYAASGLMCAFGASRLPVFFGGRILMGLSAASAIPLGLLLIGRLYSKEVRGRRVGWFFSSSFVSALSGIVLSGLADWRWLFVAPAVLAGATALGFLAAPAPILARRSEARVSYLRSLRDPKIREVFAFIFALSFLYHGVYKWFGVYLDRFYRMDRTGISLLFALMSVVSFCGQVVGGHLTDRIGRRFSCRSGLILLAIATMLLIGHYPLPLLAFVLAAVSFAWTVGHNGISTVLTDFSEDHRPQIASLNSAVRFISGGLGFFVSSWFVRMSFGGTFFGIGILMAGLVAFADRIFRDVEGDDRREGGKTCRSRI